MLLVVVEGDVGFVAVLECIIAAGRDSGVGGVGGGGGGSVDVFAGGRGEITRRVLSACALCPGSGRFGK